MPRRIGFAPAICGAGVLDGNDAAHARAQACIQQPWSNARKVHLRARRAVICAERRVLFGLPGGIPCPLSWPALFLPLFVRSARQQTVEHRRRGGCGSFRPGVRPMPPLALGVGIALELQVVACTRLSAASTAIRSSGRTCLLHCRGSRASCANRATAAAAIRLSRSLRFAQAIW